MATNFPSSLDSFTNPSAADALDSVSVPHADQHANLNDAMEAVQAKLGVGSGTIGEWQDFTPNMSTSGGTVGSIAVYEAKYQKINELVIGTLFFKITSLGTGSGNFLFDLPVAWAGYSASTSDSGIGYGRESQTTGDTLQVFANSSTQGLIKNYDNSSPVGAGVGGGVTFIYRAA